MQYNSALFTIVLGCFAIQADATSLRKKSIPVDPSAEKGVGDLKEFAHLLPFHPRGQQELLMKTRCVNFLNHLLEKAAYAPEEVGSLMPKCKWTEAECAALKDDLIKRLVKPSGPVPAPGPAPAPAALVQQPVPER